MALKNISLPEIASWVYYFYLFHRDYTWPRISAWKGRANFALPVTSPYSSTVIRNLDVDTPDTRKAQSEPARRPTGAPPEPDGPSWFPSNSSPAHSCAFDWHVAFLSSWTEKPGSWWLSTSENVMSEYASAGPSSLTSVPASWPSVYFNYTMKILKYGMAVCCITQALNCTLELDRGILSPCNGKRHICHRSRSWNIFWKCQRISRPLFFNARHLWFHLCV